MYKQTPWGDGTFYENSDSALLTFPALRHFCLLPIRFLGNPAQFLPCLPIPFCPSLPSFGQAAARPLNLPLGRFFCLSRCSSGHRHAAGWRVKKLSQTFGAIHIGPIPIMARSRNFSPCSLLVRVVGVLKFAKRRGGAGSKTPRNFWIN